MQTSDLISRTLSRLGEDPVAPAYYTRAEVLRALNLAQRFYAFLSLCLESTRPFDLTPRVFAYHVMTEWPDWIAPLRVKIDLSASGSPDEFDAVTPDSAAFDDSAARSAGAGSKPKLTPCRITDLQARDSAWMTTLGQPERYACLGFDLLMLYKVPDSACRLQITYARSPVALVNDTDVPEIPEPDHSVLPDGALPLLRLKEGGQEFASTQEAFGRFAKAVQQRAAAIRMRNAAQRYDKLPMELERLDLSRAFTKVRPDLMPWRKEEPWPQTSQR